MRSEDRMFSVFWIALAVVIISLMFFGTQMFAETKKTDRAAIEAGMEQRTVPGQSGLAWVWPD